MTESAKLRIPYIAAGQAQKHVTHNEALTLLDTLVQASVIDKDSTTPPKSPSEGDCYIVAATGTGAWIGWDNRIVRYIDGEWRSYLPGAGRATVGSSMSRTKIRSSLQRHDGIVSEHPLPRRQTLAAVREKAIASRVGITISLGEGGYFHITGTTAITESTSP